MTRAGVLLVLITLGGSAARAITPADVDAAAPAAGRQLRPVLRFLASDRVMGRDNDTPGSLLAQKKLVKVLRRLGEPIHPELAGVEAFSQHFTSGAFVGTNLLAVLRGRELPDEYVVVGAHYDHMDTRSDASGACASSRAPGGGICHGATDNAAGVTAVMAVGRALARLATPPRRSVVFALWDAEEDGLVGSAWYVNHPLVPLAQTRAYVNLDIQ